MKIQTTDRTAIAQIILDAMAAGTTNTYPILEIYTGAMPSSMGGTIADTLLATLTLTSTVGTISNGVITFDAITEDASADAGGTAGWARILDKDRVEAVYLSVTATGGGGDIELNTVDIIAGGTVALNSGTITVGGA